MKLLRDLLRPFAWLVGSRYKKETPHKVPPPLSEDEKHDLIERMRRNADYLQAHMDVYRRNGNGFSRPSH